MKLVLSNMFKPSSNFLTDRSKAVLFVDHFRYLCFVFDFLILSCLFFATLWLPVWKEMTAETDLFALWYIMFSCVFFSLSHMVSLVRYGTRLY